MTIFWKSWFGRRSVIASLITPEMPVTEEKEVLISALRRVMEGGYRDHVSLRSVTRMVTDKTDRRTKNQVLQSLRRSGLIAGVCPDNPKMLQLNSYTRHLLAA